MDAAKSYDNFRGYAVFDNPALIADAFFALSKGVWLVLAPSNLLALMATLGFVLFMRRQWRTLARRFIYGSAAGLSLLCVIPFGDLALNVLERRFPPLADCVIDDKLDIAGIIILGGALSSMKRDGRDLSLMHESADRVREAARLARAFPEAPVLVSGGVALPQQGAISESILIADLLAELGVLRSRLILETGSRTTAENARNIAALSGEGHRRFILVTSGFHMPRAVGAARAQGLNVLPAPTDWRIDAGTSFANFNASDRLTKVDLAMKEFIGLAAYAATGQSSELFPAAEQAPCSK